MSSVGANKSLLSKKLGFLCCLSQRSKDCEKQAQRHDEHYVCHGLAWTPKGKGKSCWKGKAIGLGRGLKDTPGSTPEEKTKNKHKKLHEEESGYFTFDVNKKPNEYIDLNDRRLKSVDYSEASFIEYNNNQAATNTSKQKLKHYNSEAGTSLNDKVDEDGYFFFDIGVTSTPTHSVQDTPPQKTNNSGKRMSWYVPETKEAVAFLDDLLAQMDPNLCQPSGATPNMQGVSRTGADKLKVTHKNSVGDVLHYLDNCISPYVAQGGDMSQVQQEDAGHKTVHDVLQLLEHQIDSLDLNKSNASAVSAIKVLQDFFHSSPNAAQELSAKLDETLYAPSDNRQQRRQVPARHLCHSSNTSLCSSNEYVSDLEL